MKVALCLSSGGARGIAHLSVIKALVKHNIPIDMISGSSMGSVVGGLFALGYSVTELENIALSLNKKDTKRILDFTIPKESLLKGVGAKDYLKYLFKDKTFDDLKIPFYPITTDLVSGKAVMITDGYLWEAVYASSAIPGFFKPLKKGDMIFVDGAVTDPLPVDVVSHKADFIIASRIRADYDNVSLTDKFLALYYVLRSLSLLELSLSESILERNPVDYLFDFKGIIKEHVFAFDKARDIIKVSDRFVAQHINELLAKLP